MGSKSRGSATPRRGTGSANSSRNGSGRRKSSKRLRGNSPVPNGYFSSGQPINSVRNIAARFSQPVVELREEKRMSNALNRRLVSLLVLWALVFSGFLVVASVARADTPALPAPNALDSSTSVTHSRDSLTPTTATGDSSIRIALDKMDPSLQPVAQSRQKGLSDVLIYTTNMPQLGKALQAAGARIAYTVDDQTRMEKFVARPWGATGQMVSIYVQVPN